MKHRNWIGWSRSIIWLLLYSLLWLMPVPGNGQASYNADSIAYHGRELVRNQDLAVRERAFDYLNTHMGTFLSARTDFRDTFPRIEGLAVLEREQLSLRIVTYQLYLDTSTYEYGGWIQSGLLEDPVLLTDASAMWEDETDLDYMEMGSDNWYGALYYDVKPLSVTGDEQTLILFGLDNFHLFTKRKLLETLVIREGEVRFGEPAVEMEADLPREYWKKRFILDYSVQAPATLRYDAEREKIIFDHLVFMPSDIPEQRIMRVPDGTYSGFEIAEEVPKLVFIEKVFSETLDEAPGGRPGSRERRDLFGNPID